MSDWLSFLGPRAERAALALESCAMSLARLAMPLVTMNTTTAVGPYKGLNANADGPAVILYLNWRNQIAPRRVVPLALRFGVCRPYHLEPEWLLEAMDLDRNAARTFACSRILAWDWTEEGLGTSTANVFEKGQFKVIQIRDFPSVEPPLPSSLPPPVDDVDM